MGVLVGSLVLALVCSVSYTYVLLGADDEEPTVDIVWPSEYYFKGQTMDMETGVVHPFRMWFSTEYNRSRMELYDREINNYYVADTEEKEGGVYKVLTITTANMTNVIECLYVKGGEEPTDFLPSTDGMENTQSYVLNGKVVQEWKRSDNYGDVFRLEDTILVYRTEQGVDIPIIYSEKKFDLVNGKLEDYTMTEYYDYNLSIKNEDLQIIHEETCEKMGSDFKNNLKFLHPSIDLDLAFDGYKNHHNKKYKDNEQQIRKSIFLKNWRHVVDHNRKNLSYKLTVNKFADRTEEELQSLTGTRPSKPGSEATHTFHTIEEVENLVEELPKEFDLRLKGAMRPVKHQGSCGSCWAFSSTATVEGAISYGLGGRDIDLSEQSLVDCAWGYNNAGCSGGVLDDVFKYILAEGIPSDEEYGPYKEEEGKCHVQNLTSTFKIRGYGKVNHDSVNSLKLALNEYGPVAVSVMATYNMKLYSSGIFYDVDCEGGSVNHGVVVVGYGERNGDMYWVVRNSWGEDWGEDGYILMAADSNNCFLLGDPYYVVV